MKKHLITVVISVLFALSCGDDGDDDGDDESATGGSGGSDQAGASESEGGSSGSESTEPLCPGGVATKTLILVKTVEELAALSDCTSLKGLAILISENTTLDALSNVTTMSGALTLEDCGMSSLKGLNNLKDVGGDLVIKNCSELINLDDLENLKRVGGRLTIRDNNALSDVKGISGLQSIGLGVGQGLTFRNNPSLPNCQATEVANNLAIDDEALVIICGNMMDDCGSEACMPET